MRACIRRETIELQQRLLFARSDGRLPVDLAFKQPGKEGDINVADLDRRRCWNRSDR